MEVAGSWTERAVGLANLSTIIKFFTATQAAFKAARILKESKTKEGMRGLLGTKCICTKNTGTKSAGRQKKLFGCCGPAVQKSPLKERSECIPFPTPNKNCSSPSLLLWNILLTRPIKTTRARYTRVTHLHPACQKCCEPTSRGFNFVSTGWGCEQMSTHANTCWKNVEANCHFFFFGPTFNNAYLLWDQQCSSVSECSEIGWARLAPPSSWWNRLGSLCSLSNRLPLDRQAAGLAEWQKFGTP